MNITIIPFSIRCFTTDTWSPSCTISMRFSVGLQTTFLPSFPLFNHMVRLPLSSRCISILDPTVLTTNPRDPEPYPAVDMYICCLYHIYMSDHLPRPEAQSRPFPWKPCVYCTDSWCIFDGFMSLWSVIHVYAESCLGYVIFSWLIFCHNMGVKIWDLS